VVSPASGCNEHFQPRHHFARPLPTAGLVREARKGAQLGVAAVGMMVAQIVGGLCHQRVKRCIAGEAENIVGAVVFRPLHRLDTTIMTVAAPHDASSTRCGDK
jgi:hypothetical protein